MKKNILVVLILSVLFVGCFSSNNSNTREEGSNMDMLDENENKIIGDELEFIGTYDSKTGVMVNISCYCFQTGYFTSKEGKEFVICFEDGTEEAPCSKKLKIIGYFENVVIEPENTSPCPKGERELFYVTKFECL